MDTPDDLRVEIEYWAPGPTSGPASSLQPFGESSRLVRVTGSLPALPERCLIRSLALVSRTLGVVGTIELNRREYGDDDE